MSVISSARRGSKALPVIPVDTDSYATAREYNVQWPSMSPQRQPPWNTNKALPSITVENSLSSGEMDRLHDIWNGAALSARAHRQGGRGQGSRTFKVPDPISVPDPKYIPTASPSASLSVKSATLSSTGTRKRWGILSARPQFETPETEKDIRSALEVLRVKAQEQLKKKLKYTKSTPNLGQPEDSPVKEVIAAKPIAPTLGAKEGDVANKLSSEAARKSVTLEELEEMDSNAIYFTVDPSWRANSQGSLPFKFITPVPDDHGPLERPDSPLLHRHHSLDQLSSAAQEFPVHWSSMELTVVDSSGGVGHPIDELHSYLEF